LSFVTLRILIVDVNEIMCDRSGDVKLRVRYTTIYGYSLDIFIRLTQSAISRCHLINIMNCRAYILHVQMHVNLMSFLRIYNLALTFKQILTVHLSQNLISFAK